MVPEIPTSECRVGDYSSLLSEELLSEVEPLADRLAQLATDWLLTRAEIRYIGTVSTDVGLRIAEEQNLRTMRAIVQWLKENGCVISHNHSEPHYVLSVTKWEALLKAVKGEKNLSPRVSRFDRQKHPWE